jgi:hypothetical protein
MMNEKKTKTKTKQKKQNKKNKTRTAHKKNQNIPPSVLVPNLLPNCCKVLGIFCTDLQGDLSQQMSYKKKILKVILGTTIQKCSL